jgi:hypothetical protein
MKHALTLLATVLLKKRPSSNCTTLLAIHRSSSMKAIFVLLLAIAATISAKDIRVLVWGEHFRSGCVLQMGKGRVFYFCPGHET